MRAISISNDIVPIAEFKTNISKWFKTLQTSGHPLVITQNSKPAGVLLSAADYDELVYRKSFLDSVDRGMADADSGRTQTTDELRMSLQVRRSARNPCA
jgi:antitoxin YefM